ncbi:MAG: hypothetical protein WCH77_01455 [Planctomycetota bacterium]
MAKSSSVPGLDRIRHLFTSAELDVLESSTEKQLLAASQKQLDNMLALARGLRDKWRGLHTTQARTTKRSVAAGTAAANARSRKKSDAFAAAIERIQARLAEGGFASAAAKPAAAKQVTKAARTAGHRMTRAGMREKLAEAKAEINRSRAPKSKAKPVAKPAVPVANPAPAVARKAATVPVAKLKRGKQRRPAGASAALKAKAANQPLRFDVTQQRSAKASATAARLKIDGKVTRRVGHTLAAGKRRQAARDSRGK